ncbi:MAG: SatD family protein [Flavobacteriales bacterium]
MANRPSPIILMADIVGSSDAPQPAGLMKAFGRVVGEVGKANAHHFRSPITITLGDEFQSVARDVAAAVGVIIALEEAIVRKGGPFKLRYVLHEGRIDTPINTERAHAMLGPGLTDARTMLGELKKDRRSRFRVAVGQERLSGLLNDAFLLFGALVDEWGTKDLPLVAAFLKHGGYREVADALGKDTSLMWRRDKGLRMEEYAAAKRLLLSLAGLKAA